MAEQKQNFVLVPDPEPEPEPAPPPPPGTWLERIRSVVDAAVSLVSSGTPRAVTTFAAPARPRLIFGFDATPSRQPAWNAARGVTDALVKALPGELDVAP